MELNLNHDLAHILQFTPEKHEMFINITASIINDYCVSNNDCEEVSRRKRNVLFKRSILYMYIMYCILYMLIVAIDKEL